MQRFQVVWVLLYHALEVFPLLHDILVLRAGARLVAIDDEPIKLLEQHLDLLLGAVVHLGTPLHHPPNQTNIISG